jgi:hypothetical protein
MRHEGLGSRLPQPLFIAFVDSGATTDDRPLVSWVATADMPEEPDRGQKRLSFGQERLGNG